MFGLGPDDPNPNPNPKPKPNPNPNANLEELDGAIGLAAALGEDGCRADPGTANVGADPTLEGIHRLVGVRVRGTG